MDKELKTTRDEHNLTSATPQPPIYQGQGRTRAYAFHLSWNKYPNAHHAPLKGDRHIRHK
jgi:hypothetical protein